MHLLYHMGVGGSMLFTAEVYGILLMLSRNLLNYVLLSTKREHEVSLILMLTKNTQFMSICYWKAHVALSKVAF